jgi:hypothetical protein
MLWSSSCRTHVHSNAKHASTHLVARPHIVALPPQQRKEVFVQPPRQGGQQYWATGCCCPRQVNSTPLLILQC